jgi:hypothetical protein
MSKKYSQLLFLLVLPAIIIFDIVVYMMTRVSCFECGGIGTFVQNSSLANAVILETLRVWKKV